MIFESGIYDMAVTTHDGVIRDGVLIVDLTAKSGSALTFSGGAVLRSEADPDDPGAQETTHVTLDVVHTLLPAAAIGGAYAAATTVGKNRTSLDFGRFALNQADDKTPGVFHGTWGEPGIKEGTVTIVLRNDVTA